MGQEAHSGQRKVVVESFVQQLANERCWEIFPPLICLVKLTDFQPNAGCTLNKTLRLANPLTSPQGFYSPRGSLINDHVKYYAFKKVPPISLRVNRVHYVRSYPPASFSAIYISIQLELRQSSPRPRKLNLSETHLLSIFFFFQRSSIFFIALSLSLAVSCFSFPSGFFHLRYCFNPRSPHLIFGPYLFLLNIPS